MYFCYEKNKLIMYSSFIFLFTHVNYGQQHKQFKLHSNYLDQCSYHYFFTSSLLFVNSTKRFTIYYISFL